MSYVMVTGAEGFIGSNLVKALEAEGHEVSAVSRWLNDDMLYWNQIEGALDIFVDRQDAVFHLGACTDTTEYDPEKMMYDNFTVSKTLFDRCRRKGIPFIYASSASVYGLNTNSAVDPSVEKPVNIYAKSKLLFDNYVRCFLPQMKSPVIGLRYFNVYGPGEENKGKMASMVHQFYQQAKKDGIVKPFRGSEHLCRDFVSVDDIVKINLHFLDKNNQWSGIYNCGTGQWRKFTDLVDILKTHIDFERKDIPFPESLRGKYQQFTQADLSLLRNRAKYKGEFKTLEQGIKEYIEYMENK